MAKTKFRVTRQRRAQVNSTDFFLQLHTKLVKRCGKDLDNPNYKAGIQAIIALDVMCTLAGIPEDGLVTHDLTEWGINNSEVHYQVERLFGLLIRLRSVSLTVQ